MPCVANPAIPYTQVSRKYRVRVQSFDKLGQPFTYVPPTDYVGTIEAYLQDLTKACTWIAAAKVFWGPGRGGRSIYTLMSRVDSKEYKLHFEEIQP